MNSNAVFGILLLIVLGGGYYFMAISKTPPAPVTSAEVLAEEQVVEGKTFEIKGLNYTYDVKEIRVKLNDNVKINFTNTEGMHDLKIDELGVATKVIKIGEMESVEFVASKVGTFEYYCSVGQHRANGMWGKLIVE